MEEWRGVRGQPTHVFSILNTGSLLVGGGGQPTGVPQMRNGE